METELPLLKKLPSFRPRIFDSTQYSAISRDQDQDSDDNSNIDDLRYTSLKDLILSSSPRLLGSAEGSTFDSSTILIRNELVKHAASAYIQSATSTVSVTASRDHQTWLSELCEKLHNNNRTTMVSRSCWHLYFRTPLRSCFRPVFRFFDYVVNGIGRTFCYQ